MSDAEPQPGPVPPPVSPPTQPVGRQDRADVYFEVAMTEDNAPFYSALIEALADGREIRGSFRVARGDRGSVETQGFGVGRFGPASLRIDAEDVAVTVEYDGPTEP